MPEATGQVCCLHHWCYFYVACIVLAGTQHPGMSLSIAINGCKTECINVAVILHSHVHKEQADRRSEPVTVIISYCYRCKLCSLKQQITVD